MDSVARCWACRSTWTMNMSRLGSFRYRVLPSRLPSGQASVRRLGADVEERQGARPAAGLNVSVRWADRRSAAASLSLLGLTEQTRVTLGGKHVRPGYSPDRTP